MDRRFAAVIVVASFAIIGCTTGQPSGGESASPSLDFAQPGFRPSMAPTPTTPPAQPDSQHRSGLDLTMAHSLPAPTGSRSGTRAAASTSQAAAHRPRMTPSA